MPASTPGSEFHTEWVAALDRLELDVDRAEQLLRSAEPLPLPEWTPPAVRGVLPEDLIPRARLIHERQLAVTHRITERVASTYKQQQLADRIRGNTPPDVPVYVDLTA